VLSPEELQQIQLEDKQDKSNCYKSDDILQSEWRKVYSTYTAVTTDDYTEGWDREHGFTGLQIKNGQSKPSKHHSSYSQEIIDKIVEFRNQGMSFTDISTELNVPRPSVATLYYKEARYGNKQNDTTSIKSINTLSMPYAVCRRTQE
jgi:hypothetical protein